MVSYNGKIPFIDLTTRSVIIKEFDASFYRKYMGGSALGAYFLLTEMPRGADPLGPDNVLVIAVSVVTGAPVTGFSRANMTAKSPLTKGIGDSQFGGFWPTLLKKNGFDALVINGKSEKPIYLYIENGNIHIKDANKVWGFDTGDTEDFLKEEVKDKKARVLSIGKAGENLVYYACAISESKFAAGRTGLGAVMGSKKLKAIVVGGKGVDLDFYDTKFLKEKARQAPKRIKSSPQLSAVQKMGSSVGVSWQNKVGGLPTKNFQKGFFDSFEKISGETIYEEMNPTKHTCYACALACKKSVGTDKPFKIDERYGSAEYETTAAFGSYLLIDDPYVICKANELCNRYGIDTISLGAIAAFLMECFERELLHLDDTDGINLTFGKGESLLELIERIANREGLGDVLGYGFEQIVRQMGEEVESFALHVKGNPFPAHMPRIKQSLALTYAITPIGADHMASVHDNLLDPSVPEEVKKNIRCLGIYKDIPIKSISGKSKYFYYTSMVMALFDTLLLCARAISVYSYKEIVEMVEACTGWEVSLWELLKVGERRNNLLRIFNAREGFTSKDDKLPYRMFEPLQGEDGVEITIDPVDFEKEKIEFYRLAGWDTESGNPRWFKLKELELEWVLDRQNNKGG